MAKAEEVKALLSAWEKGFARTAVLKSWLQKDRTNTGWPSSTFSVLAADGNAWSAVLFSVFRMSDRIKGMIRRAAAEVGGLGVSPAFRPGASPVEATWPKSSSPEAGEGKPQQGRQGFARVVGWIPLPQGAVNGVLTNHRRRSSDSAIGSEPRPTTR